MMFDGISGAMLALLAVVWVSVIIGLFVLVGFALEMAKQMIEDIRISKPALFGRWPWRGKKNGK